METVEEKWERMVDEATMSFNPPPDDDACGGCGRCYECNYGTPETGIYHGVETCSCGEPLEGQTWREEHGASGEHFVWCKNCQSGTMVD